MKKKPSYISVLIVFITMSQMVAFIIWKFIFHKESFFYVFGFTAICSFGFYCYQNRGK